jgi:hypothetical protein
MRFSWSQRSFAANTISSAVRVRVGKALGAQGIEIDLIVASQLDVLDPLSAG